VTLRVREDVPSLRTVRFVRAFERSLAKIRDRASFRVVHYSLQSNHAHFIVEAGGRDALGRGMKSLGARLARAVNRAFDRKGPVLLNAKRHSSEGARRPGRAVRCVRLDPASSARWFDGWKRSRSDPEMRPSAGEACTSRARTWLLGTGWRRHGLLDPSEVPGPSA
jgi:REP element-mobilizing transposase RayT